jgi:hypothetical protein
MVLEIQHRSRSEALAHVASALSIEGSPPLVEVGVMAAHLRAGCELNCEPNGAGVHTSRLIEMTIRNLAGLLDRTNDIRPFAHEVLNRLGASGDLWRSEGGYWQTTPARTIVLPSLQSFLLGTLSDVPGAVVAQGAVRYVRTNLSQNVPTQGIDDWLGREDPIDVWMEKALRSYGSRMQQSGLVADHLQIYAPEQARRLAQPSWIDARDFEIGSMGLRLCRATATKTTIYNRPYFLGQFVRDNKSVRLARAASVTHAHSRRFRFAFDTALSARRRVRVKQEGDTIHLTIANDLPSEEQRVLALGWNAGEASSPAVRRLMFPARAMPFVAHAFARLGILIDLGNS